MIERVVTTSSCRVVPREDLERLLKEYGDLDELTSDELRDAVSAELDRAEYCSNSPISWHWLERYEEITDGVLTVRPATTSEASQLDYLVFDDE